MRKTYEIFLPGMELPYKGLPSPSREDARVRQNDIKFYLFESMKMFKQNEFQREGVNV